MLGSILAQNGSINFGEVAICTAVSLVLGVLIALVYMFRSVYTKNFVITIALLPVLIQSVIMVVNGNLGTGVAVMGAFGLVRFRSAPGSAKEIITIFFTMAVGLACGMGYVVYAALFTGLISLAMVLLICLRFGEGEKAEKTLRITIPEDLEYTDAFTDLFTQYTAVNTLMKVRTTNLGGLYELQYNIVLKDVAKEKEMIDALRQRNGNLTIVCGMPATAKDEL